MAECLLGKLRSPLVRSPLPGLIVHPHGIELMQKHLTCCAGTGLMYDAGEDLTRHCSLTRRLALVAALARQASVRDDGDSTILARAAATPVAPEVIRQFTGISAGGKTGIAVAAGDAGQNLQVAYALALAAVWRFEIRTAVVELGKSASLDRFVLSLTQNNERQPDLVVVAGIGRLWETQRLEHLEILIGAAYRGHLPLVACLEKIPVPSEETPAPAGFRRSAVKDRLRDLRNRHPFDHLSAGVRSQLAAVCAGAEKKKAAPSAEKKAPTRLSPEA
jgi:hypothetical protein